MSIEPAATEPGEAGGKQTVDAIYHAREIAISHGHDVVTLEHMLASLLVQPDVIETLTAIKIDIDSLKEDVEEFFSQGLLESNGASPEATPMLNELITRAVATAVVSERKKATPTDLLLHMVSMPHEDSHAITLLLKNGVTPLALKKQMSHGSPNTMRSARSLLEDGSGPSAQVGSREEAEAYLEQFTVNLNAAAADLKIDPLIGRKNEVAAVLQVLNRRQKNNPILIGEPGVGKTAIAEGLALLIVRGEVPSKIKDSIIYSLDIGALMAGARFRGDFEERMKLVLRSLAMIPNSILFIDEIHTIIGAGAGSQGSVDVSNLLKPALAKGEIRCIGSTTLEEFRKHFEKDRALLRRFRKIEVTEPSIEDAKAILKGLAPYYEAYHKVSYTEEALIAAVELSSKYITNAFLPDKAIDLIDNAGASQNTVSDEDRKAVISLTEIEAEVMKVTKIPAKTVSTSDTEKLRTLSATLASRVIGQDTALLALKKAAYRSNAGLRPTNKTAGSYLFTGPTGVGKTEAAKALSETLGIPLIRYDMSEFMEKHSVSKLIGSPPGYVGFGDGGAGSGRLSNDISATPYCVLLLDEFEKAHPDVYNILLQIMDNGVLTDSNGKEVSFRNVYLIMTSNAGAQEQAKSPLGFGKVDNADADESVIKRMFAPEFLNRLDANVKFSRLKQSNVRFIVDKFLKELNLLAAEKNVVINVDDEAREWLAKNGYDAVYGARPLSRIIDVNIGDVVSEMIIEGPLDKGGEVNFVVVDDKVVIAA